MESLEERQVLTNNLLITEIMYNPPVAADSNQDNDNYEYIEVYNAGTATLTLTGVTIQARQPSATTVMSFTFPTGYQLAGGAYALAVKNTAAFTSRYGAQAALKIAGQFTSGNLPNSDQVSGSYTPVTMRLSTPAGINDSTLVTFVYDDGTNFPSRPDGDGASLELINPSTSVNAAYYADTGNWQSSDEYLGTPGYAGIGEHTKRIRINELLANSPGVNGDNIELINTSHAAVDLGGWMLTDNSDNSTSGKLGYYAFPNGTILRSGEYLVVNESQFNPTTAPANQNAFALSSGGEGLFLISKEADGARLFEDIVRYDATRTSQSIGRSPNATGSFLPMSSQTFGAANSAQALSDVVITEIMYKHPTNNDNLRYIELTNRTASAVTLGINSASRWKISGADFSFPVGASIAANSSILVVGFDPASAALKNAFNAAYPGTTSTPMFGPWTSNLSSNGERIVLLQPFNDPGPPAAVVDVLVDSVDFDKDSPWPQSPYGGVSGTAYSLTRTGTTNIGDNPYSWRAATPSPGTLSLPGTASPLEGLVISEVMYYPLPENPEIYGIGSPPTVPYSFNHLEYIEVYNPTASAKTLTGAAIGRGVDFKFPEASIGPGERIVVVPFNPTSALATEIEKRDKFFARYGLASGEVTLYGPWVGSLNNGGEGLSLIDAVGNTFLNFEYNDRGGWPELAAGKGASLELTDPSAVPTGVANTEAYLNDPTHWRNSVAWGGTPGTDPMNPTASVIINEVNTHTDPPFTDAVEFLNTGPIAVNLQDWVLTDDIGDTTKWFPLPPITLNPGEYVTIDSETSRGGWGTTFSLNASQGETLYLIEADATGTLQRFAQVVEVPATFTDVSLGRWLNGSSGEMFPQISRTLSQYNTANDPTNPIPLPGNVYTNGANSGPKFDDIVVSEVMYNPTGPNANDFEYIELFNRVGVALNLGPIEDDTLWTKNKAEGWRIRGSVDFDFTAAHTIPANGTMLIVSFDPGLEPAKLTAFKSRYGLGSSTVPIVGPFQGYVPLPDDGGEVDLEKPDTAQTILNNDEKFTPNVLVDRVTYDDVAPWPTNADGGGNSLVRNSATAYGDFAESWTGATPSPGSFTPPAAAAPRVTGVVVGGSQWGAAFKTAVTSVGSPVQGYTIPKGATQTSAIPWEGVNQVSITFDRDVTIGTSALAVRGVNTANYTVGATPTYNAATRTATWTVSTPINGDKLILELDDAKVSAAALALDGEWTDGSSAASSGNGTAGGDFLLRFNVLPGDVDRDGDVQNDDFQDVRMSMFTSVGVGNYDILRDVNGSGEITYVDWIFARNHLNTALPAGTANSPEAPASVVARASTSSRPLTAVRSTARAARPAAVDQALAAADVAAETSNLSALRARRTARPSVASASTLSAE